MTANQLKARDLQLRATADREKERLAYRAQNATIAATAAKVGTDILGLIAKAYGGKK